MLMLEYTENLSDVATLPATLRELILNSTLG